MMIQFTLHIEAQNTQTQPTASIPSGEELPHERQCEQREGDERDDQAHAAGSCPPLGFVMHHVLVLPPQSSAAGSAGALAAKRTFHKNM
jgi:hypothetical protein